MLKIEKLKTLSNRKNKNVFVPDDMILDTVENSVKFLSDFIPADIHLYKLENDSVKVIAEAKPSMYPSFYKRTHIDYTFPLNENPLFEKVYNQKNYKDGKQGSIFNGFPLYQTLYPIMNNNSNIIGFLMIEKSLFEYRKWKLKQNWLFQIIIKDVIDAILESSLIETKSLPPMYPVDGLIVIDMQGYVYYSNYTATNTAKNLGLSATTLEGSSLEEVFNRGTTRTIEENPLYTELELEVDSFTINVKSIPLNNLIIILLRDVSELRQKDQEIKVKSAIIREIHHRVKNNLQSISSLLRLQQRRISNQETKDILNDSINRINSISIVHDYLSQKNVEVVDIVEMSKNILSEVRNSVVLPDKDINFVINMPNSLLFPSGKAVSIALVLNELLNNTLKHAFKSKDSGVLSLSIDVNSELLTIIVEDDGVGLPENFSPDKNSNLGWEIIKTLVKDDLKGRWEIDSTLESTKVIISIPSNK